MIGDRLTNGRVFAAISPGFTDGIRADMDGNLWCSMGWADPSEDGVRCYAPDGTLIGKIQYSQELLNLPVSPAGDLAQKELAELQRLLEGLQTQLRGRLD